MLSCAEANRDDQPEIPLPAVGCGATRMCSPGDGRGVPTGDGSRVCVITPLTR